ncbi:hypothetical protein N866_19630 [Actinotalea ferrariae CF5-4]|uniref:FAS1 domain-containing protein n=1 Tax=Actinotalea ferrariae CF5-4 TaxID=948458 RepID=A0A021VUX8_9CELL|nr:fasciclin domain-containing protein [Actinotalea ferrariae]EYR65009.1 hypothetical protein N866_19630 [Actinotalea ferrariae CF5-4]
MRHRRLLSCIAAGAVAAGSTVALAPVASAAGHAPTSLAEVLLADGDDFDSDWNDFDIVTQAVVAVATGVEGTPVTVLLDGDVALTAFIPTDRAFRALVQDLSGQKLDSEADVFAAVAALGLPAVEQVLLDHVVLGATVTSAVAVTADGAELGTAGGDTLVVDVRRPNARQTFLLDGAGARDAHLSPSHLDINLGNPQVAHGISEVLLFP